MQLQGNQLKKTAAGLKIPAILCAVTIGIVMIIEARHPYFFLQDDNRVQHLPRFVHNIRSLLSGEFPFFNFHQYLGTPVTIQAASLYPINYIALSLSSLLLGNYFGAMEFIAGLHLLIAAFGFFYMLRMFDLGELSCLFGAIAWAFCGFVITVGNSWIETIGYAAYLPWLILFSLKLMNEKKYATFIALVALRLSALLVGHPQYYIYSITFEFMTLVLLHIANDRKTAREIPLKQGTILRTGYFSALVKDYIPYALSHVTVLLLALPVLLPTFYQTSISISRKSTLAWEEYVSNSYNIKLFLLGLAAPFYEAGVDTWNELQFISHVGYVTILFVLVALFHINKTDKGRHILVFSILALFSLLWAGDIVITKIVYHLPVFNKLRHPFKLGLFTSFYLIIVASFGWDIFQRKIVPQKSGRDSSANILLVVLLSLHISNFIFNYTMLRQYRFSVMLDQVPLDEPLKNELVNGRIVSVGPDTIDNTDKFMGYTAPLLGYNYATLWGLSHFGGYDSLVSEKNIRAALGLSYHSTVKVPPQTSMDVLLKSSLAYYRKWGVRWYAVDRNIPVSDFGGLVLVQGDNYRNIYYDPSARSFAYWTDNLNVKNIQFKFLTNSIEVATQRPSDGALIVNVLHNPFFTATLDGVGTRITETPDQQMEISVPEGRHSIVVRYSDPYFRYGAILSIACMVMLAGNGVRLAVK